MVAVGPKIVMARDVSGRPGCPRNTLPLTGLPRLSVSMPSAVNRTDAAPPNLRVSPTMLEAAKLAVELAA